MHLYYGLSCIWQQVCQLCFRGWLFYEIPYIIFHNFQYTPSVYLLTRLAGWKPHTFNINLYHSQQVRHLVILKLHFPCFTVFEIDICSRYCLHFSLAAINFAFFSAYEISICQPCQTLWSFVCINSNKLSELIVSGKKP